jgi:hypothetical protein
MVTPWVEVDEDPSVGRADPRTTGTHCPTEFPAGPGRHHPGRQEFPGQEPAPATIMGR